MTIFTLRKPVIARTRRIAILLILVGASWGIYYIAGILADQRLLFWATGSREKAFLNATWEMSPQEIRRANRAYLAESGFHHLLYSLDDPLFPPVMNMSRYEALEQKGLTLWGENATVEYGFFDDRLLTYRLSFEPFFDFERIRDTIVAEITKKYGQFTTGEDLHPYAKWNADRVFVYMEAWTNDRTRGRIRVSGGGRVQVVFIYKPFLTKIKQISENEKQGVF